MKPKVRIRLFVSGTVVDETWIEAGQSEDWIKSEGTRAGLICRDANRRGDLWLFELYNPAAPHPRNAYVRYGTDVGMMTQPEPIAPKSSAEVAERLIVRLASTFGPDDE